MAEVASWIVEDLEACSEEAEAETEAASGEAEEWIEEALVAEEEEDPEVLLGLSWSRWEAEEAGVEDLGKWIKASTVRSAETGPTRRRTPRRAAFTTRFIF